MQTVSLPERRATARPQRRRDLRPCLPRSAQSRWGEWHMGPGYARLAGISADGEVEPATHVRQVGPRRPRKSLAVRASCEGLSMLWSDARTSISRPPLGRFTVRSAECQAHYACAVGIIDLRRRCARHPGPWNACLASPTPRARPTSGPGCPAIQAESGARLPLSDRPLCRAVRQHLSHLQE